MLARGGIAPGRPPNRRLLLWGACLLVCLIAPVASTAMLRGAATKADTDTDADMDTDTDTNANTNTQSYYVAASHEISDAEREYTPDHQLDTDGALHTHFQKIKQNSRLNRFRQRLAAQSLVARERKLTAHAKATEEAAISANTDDTNDDTGHDTGHDTTTDETAANHNTDGISRGGSNSNGNSDSDGWLARLRFATQHQTSRQSQGQSQRQRTAAGVGAGVGAGGEDDVPGERLMATDEAKEQEVPYEVDKTSNFWWWDAWAPYIA